MKTLHLAGPPYQEGAERLQKALHAAKLFGGKIDNLYGPSTAHAAYVAKWRFGYPNSALHKNHEYAGATLMAYLTGKKALPLSYRIRRNLRLHPTTKEQQIRAQVVKAYQYLIDREPQIYYAQTRPIPFPAPFTLPGGSLTTDCSGSVTIACRWGGAKDPNGLNFNGAGYTGTLLSHLPHISREHAQPGDLIVFGPGTGHHVVMILRKVGDDFLTGSHGQNSGPIEILLSKEQKYQPAPVTFLSII